MTDQKDKKGFWGTLLRHGSLAKRVDKSFKEQLRDGSGNGNPPNRRPESGAGAAGGPRQRRRPRRPSPAPDSELGRAVSGAGYSRRSKGVGWEDEPNGRSRPPKSRLTVWPPNGLASVEDLPPQHAQELISRGAPCHKGHKREIPHAPDHYYALYATSAGNRGDGSDAADIHDAMTQFMTMRMHSPGHASNPWETLEQPSYSFFYGRHPGTVTLNQWASLASALPPTIALRDSGVTPREMDLERVFERLKELQSGLEDDDEDLLYRILYKRMLKDPDKILSPHRTLDKQITDLILVLSRPDWIDFTNPKNQVVTRFIFDTGEESHDQYHKFFHQLLLSLELELRIQSPQHSKWAKEKLLRQIPPTIQWNLALARRWREFVRVYDWGMTAEDTRLRYKLKKRRVKTLKRFAQAMKWPNLAEVLDNLAQKDEESSLDAISSDTFAFFSGLVLPGPTFPFLIMNTLIDLDPDPATDDLALLSHIHPHCGFQYRNSYTYWSATCIVGKVLAPTCSALAGWIGPARPTADLGRSQIARIRSRQPKQLLRAEDVETMAERSDALGPHAEAYPVHEYNLVLPNTDDIVDTVRIELLGLRPADANVGMIATGPRLFDATVQFAIDGASWPLRLMYDVTFVSAWPCSGGPHPLFFDYVYRSVKVDEIVDIRDWGRLYGGQGGSHSARSSPAPGSPRHRDRHGALGTDWHSEEYDEDDEEKVLVVEAFGVRDNEVLARAWCSHWGLSAIVADIRKTCMSCAIREAYAATLTVLILVQGTDAEDDEDEVGPVR